MKPSKNGENEKSRATLYPVPVEEDAADKYTVIVDGQRIFTHPARVSRHPINQVWPGYQRPIAQTEIVSFALWDMAGPVDISVACDCPIRDIRIRPSSAGIKAEVDRDTARFRIDGPGQFTVEINGTHQALHLFANPPEQNPPERCNESVRYFGPGVHCPGIIRVENGQTLYIAAGAIVYGAIFAENASSLSIRGRGILDGSKCDRMDVNGLICLINCSDVQIDGITLRDSSGWAIAPVASRDIRIHNVKLIGNWRYNTDGIDFVSCQDCTVEDSFIRSFDDSIALKGFEKWGPFVYQIQLPDGRKDGTLTIDGTNRRTFHEIQDELGLYPCLGRPINNIQVRNCVIWNEWGRALEIGAESVASEICDILFEDCDIIHTGHVAMDIQNCDRAKCRNIVFRDIRVEFDDDCTPPVLQTHRDQIYQIKPGELNSPRLIVLEVVVGYCTYDSVRGSIEDVVFENIKVTSRDQPQSLFRGFDSAHQISGVSIKDLFFNGRRVDSLPEGGFVLNDFVREVVIAT